MDSTNEPIHQEEGGAENAKTAARDDCGKKLEACEKEREEYLNGWKRAKADLINYTKDEAKRFEEVVRFANERTIEQLLQVLDSFDLGILTLEKDSGAVKGMSLIRAQLMDVLGKQGLKEIAVHAGDALNPEFHEAIAEVESGEKPGTIHEVVERGYTLHHAVLRPARVKVAKDKKV